MAERKRLSDILANSDRDRLEKSWSSTKAADDLKPLPAGEYHCRVVSGELFTSKGGTPGYKIAMEIADGEHAGRRLWLDIWLSEAALPLAKRDLGKIGVENLSQLERPLPSGIVIAAKVALRRGDDGAEFNRVSRFEVVAVEPPASDPFAPKDSDAAPGSTDADGFDWSTGATKRGADLMSTTPYGFRVVGGKAGERRLIDHRAALAGYAACDPRAEPDREAFLSHLTFGAEFRQHLETEGSERGYNGRCGADWLFLDIDRPNDLEQARRDSRRVAGVILERYRLDDDDLLIFLSGGKGFHIGLSTALWHPESSPRFNEVAKRFCLDLAQRAGVVADPTVYSKTRLFRAPNSRHPSGRYKRRLSLDEVTFLKPEAILALAVEPVAFDLPTPTAPSADRRERLG